MIESTEWNDEKNSRRCDLIDKEIDDSLSDEEARELEQLQQEMLVYRKKHAPRLIAELDRALEMLEKKYNCSFVQERYNEW